VLASARLLEQVLNLRTGAPLEVFQPPGFARPAGA
jgi:hypothetical protein